jgi:signal transduction histidine kinase
MEQRNYADLLHDTKSSLSGCLGLIEIVTESLEDAPEQKDNLEYLNTASQSLKSLINRFEQFMMINRLKDGFGEIKKRQFDIFAFLKNILTTFEAEFRKSEIQFIRRPLPNSQNYFVLGDEDLIARAVTNLLRNAVEEIITKNYPKSERLINIRFGNIEKETIIQVENPSDLSVKDIEKIFTENFSTKPKGNGLGTKIVQAVAAAHGGSVFASKEEELVRIGIKIPNQ